MNIFQLLEERKSKKQYIEDKEEAIKLFTKQQEAIQSISDTSGFSEIRSYWIRVMEAAQYRLMTAKDANSLASAQAEMSMASQFVTFLDNLNTR